MENSLRNGYTFEWKIENLWYCWLKKGESLQSSTFGLGQSAHTKWSLILYPKGVKTEDHVGMYLRRENDVHGPNIIKVSYQLAILDMRGSFLKVVNVTKCGFPRCSISGVEKFATQDELLGTEKEIFFPRNALIIRCAVWTKDEVLSITDQYLYASTLFIATRRSFSWNIDAFSTSKPGKTNDFQIMNESRKVIVTFYLALGLKREITLKMTLWDESLKTFAFKVSVIDSEGERVNFGNFKFFGSDFERLNKILISKKQLMQNKSRYLPNDVLSLVCEYTFSTGNISHVHEEHKLGITAIIPTKNHTGNCQKLVESQNEIQQTQPLVKDLKSMYDTAILSDIKLRTPTETFPAHKIILSARSSVFRRIFSKDMKEKNSGYLYITDLEDDTLHRMLLYIYTDVLEDLQFESASKLYSAADKYAISSLKERCSSFLKDNVSPANACDLLSLADSHYDEDLKSVVQVYILCHDKEIFGSREWNDFIATNPHLAAEIKNLKVCPT